jgi:hypothetical protein
LIDIKKRFYKNNNCYFTDKDNKVASWNKDENKPDDDLALVDLSIDILKVLTSEELLILKTSCNKTIKNIKNKDNIGIIDNIINKILNYK